SRTPNKPETQHKGKRKAGGASVCWRQQLPCPARKKEPPMRPDGFWRSCGLPVLVSAGVFCALNALWKNPRTESTLAGVLAYPVAVFMLGGSGLALVFITRALRTGRLTRHDLGLDLAGWSAPRRLAGLALLVLFSYGHLALLQRQLAGQPSQPTWGD